MLLLGAVAGKIGRQGRGAFVRILGLAAPKVRRNHTSKGVTLEFALERLLREWVVAAK
jgi:hypothetical protein